MLRANDILTALVLVVFAFTLSGCPPTHIPSPMSMEPPSLSTKTTVGKDEAGYKVIRYEQEEGGAKVVSYEIYDPYLKKSYPAINVGNDTVELSDHGRMLWEKDMKAYKEARQEAGDPCFSGDTRVLMADGRSLEISRVREGDLVRSYNTERGVVEDKRVLKTYTFPSEVYYVINGSIKATAKHPFLMAGPGEVWKKASELKLGDRIKSPEGQITVESIEKVAEEGKSYNFRVADNKAFIVSGLDKLYVVHNGL